MITMVEGNLRIEFPDDVIVRKFDDSTHGLSNCMKAVDFIVELEDKHLFIEFKDPQNPAATPQNSTKWINEFKAGTIDNDLKYKYRDSFLYEWASDKATKPIHYYVLIALDSLTEADLLMRTEALKQKLPISHHVWTRGIVSTCIVFNIATWNKHIAEYPISRV